VICCTALAKSSQQIGSAFYFTGELIDKLLVGAWTHDANSLFNSGVAYVAFRKNNFAGSLNPSICRWLPLRINSDYVYRPLESGPERIAERNTTGTYDIRADDFVDLVKQMGA